MPYLSKNIDGLVYSEEFGGWIEELYINGRVA